MSEVKNYTNYDLCKKCGGKCCKQMPGAMLPEDVMRLFPSDSLYDSLVKCFQSGNYSIDWWEGDPRDDKDDLTQAHYVRPKTISSRYSDRLYDPSYGGVCKFHDALTGCELSESERPYTCRMLEPIKGTIDFDCYLHSGGKQKCAIAWIEHSKDIEKAALFVERSG